MRYSDALETGITSLGKPDRIIETLLSKLFFFGDRVYKVYKWDRAFYGDLSDLAFRCQFIREDFFWNNSMSPDIYLKLLSVNHEGGEWIECAEDGAEDFCIVMSVTESDRTFTALAEQGILTRETAKDVVEKMIPKARIITEKRKVDLGHFFDASMRAVLAQEFQDLRDWAYMGHEFISHEEVDRIVDLALKAAEGISYFDGATERREASIDGNPDNILILTSGEIRFIDIMPPKDNWRVADEFLNICRYATEAATFMNDEIAQEIYEAYFSIIGKRISDEVRTMYEIRAALIQVPYRFVLNQPERAKKSMAFLYKVLERLT